MYHACKFVGIDIKEMLKMRNNFNNEVKNPADKAISL